MQILYGNDGTNYRTLAKSEDVPGSLLVAVHNEFNRYSFVQQEGLYQEGEEIRNLIYTSTTLRGKLTEETVFIVNNGRMPQFHTPSKFFQAYGWKADRAFYRDRFSLLFQIQWIAADQILNYMDQKLESMPFLGSEAEQEPTLELMPIRTSGSQISQGSAGKEGADKSETRKAGEGRRTLTQAASDRKEKKNASGEEALDRHTLRDILILIYRNSLSVSKKLYLTLDRGGDAYHARALQVLEQIYRYLPYDMRRTTGFSTYVSADSRESEIPQGVRLVLQDPLLPQQNRECCYQMGQPKTTLSASAASGWTAEYVDFLMALSKEERTAFFDRIEELYPNRRVTGRDCSYVYELRETMFSGDVSAQAPRWIRQYAQAENEAIRQYIGVQIQTRVSAAVYQTLVVQGLREQPEDWTAWKREFVQLLGAADLSDRFQLEEGLFWDACQTGLRSKLEACRNQSERRACLEAEYQKLSGLQFGQKFSVIVNRVRKRLRGLGEEAQILEEREIAAERRAIQEDPLLTAPIDSKNRIRFLQKWSRALRYFEPNHEFVIQCWCESMDDLLAGWGEYFLSDEEKRFAWQLLEGAKASIGETRFGQYASRLKEMGKLLERLEELKTVYLDTPEDIEVYFENEKEKAELLELLHTEPEETVLLRWEVYSREVPAETVHIMLQYLRETQNASDRQESSAEKLFELRRKIWEIFQEDRELPGILMETGLLKEEHFQDVCISAKEDEDWLDQILDYYFYERKSPITLEQLEQTADAISDSPFEELLPEYKRSCPAVREFLKESRSRRKQRKKRREGSEEKET